MHENMLLTMISKRERNKKDKVLQIINEFQYISMAFTLIKAFKVGHQLFTHNHYI